MTKFLDTSCWGRFQYSKKGEGDGLYVFCCLEFGPSCQYYLLIQTSDYYGVKCVVLPFLSWLVEVVTEKTHGARKKITYALQWSGGMIKIERGK